MMHKIISTAVMSYGILSFVTILVWMVSIEWNLIDLRETYWTGGSDYMSNPHYHELQYLQSKLGILLLPSAVIAAGGTWWKTLTTVEVSK